MGKHTMRKHKNRRWRWRQRSKRKFRPFSQLEREEAGIEDFEFGDGSELDWDDPNVGYRWNMLNDHS